MFQTLSVASGVLSAPPPPEFIVTPMAHAGTLVATDGVNVMAMNNSTSGDITVGPLSDFSQIDNTWTKPFTAASSLQVLNYGAGVFMAVDWNGKSYWSDDLGENWTVGTGHDPAFNTAQAGWYSDELAVFMHNNHQPTYSIDGKVKIDALGQPQVIQSEGGYNQLDFDGETFSYTLNSQRFIWYNIGSDFTAGWAQATREVTKSTQGIATNGLVVASVSGDTIASFVRSSTDGFTFTADIATSGLTVTRPRHIMYHKGEWVIINRDGSCWTSDDLITWTAQGDTYLTGTSSGSSNAEWHSMENQNIIRWGAGGGQSRENFAIFFLNQIYQSIVDEPLLPPSAVEAEVLIIDPDAWYKLNETSGTSVLDQINAATGTKTNTIVQEALILDGTYDAGSLQMTSGQSLSVPNSIPDSWNPDGLTLETFFMALWFRVDSLASPVVVIDHTDTTRFNFTVNTDGSVTLRYASGSVATSGPGQVVAGVNSFISFWLEYGVNLPVTLAAVRYNINGTNNSGSSAAALPATRFPDFNLGDFTVDTENGAIDELIIKYGNVAGGDPISAGTAVIWGDDLFAAGPPV